MRIWAFWGAVHAFLAVGLGAFGAHVVADRVAEDLLEVYRTGAQYHLAHAVAMLVTAGLGRGLVTEKAAGWACGLFFVGILLFSFSLYVLALSGVRAWGAVTPFGGVCFLVGWAVLAVSSLRAALPEDSPKP